MKNSYICNCTKPNFKNKYSYWEDRSSTSDENEIAFRFFTKRMGELSPEAQDVESPYLN